MRASHKIYLILIILSSLVVGSSTLRRGHEWGDDFAWYILQAKSALTNTTQKFMLQSEFTNTQSTTQVGPLAYPWGYPLILVPFYAIKGVSPLGLKLPGLFLYSGFLICLYHLTKDRLTRTESLILVSLFAFNPLLIQFEDQILSDIPFLFFSTLTLFLMIGNKKHGVIQYLLIGTSIFLTAFMRTTGVLLLGSFLILQLTELRKGPIEREKNKQIILNSFIVCFVFLFFWVINLLIFPNGEESYLLQYAGVSAEIILDLAGGYFNVFSLFFGESALWSFIYYVLFVFFMIGAWTRRKDEKVFIYFTILWMLVHITWPYWQGPRFVFPIFPIFIYFTFWGIKTVIAKLPENYRLAGERTHYGFWILIACIFLFTSSARAINNIQNNRNLNGPFDLFSMEVYEYISQKTPSDSVVVFFKPRVMVLMTGHNAIMSTECDRILLGDYLVLSRKVGENQQIPPDDIKSCDLPLEQVLKNQRFIVYKILK